jgi:hypothetical protein
VNNNINVEFVLAIGTAETEGGVVTRNDDTTLGLADPGFGDNRSSYFAGSRIGKKCLDVVGGSTADKPLELITTQSDPRDVRCGVTHRAHSEMSDDERVSNGVAFNSHRHLAVPAHFTRKARLA